MKDAGAGIGCGCMILAAGIAFVLFSLALAPVGEKSEILQIIEAIKK